MSNVVRLDVVNPIGVLVDELGEIRAKIKFLKQMEKMQQVTHHAWQLPFQCSLLSSYFLLYVKS